MAEDEVETDAIDYDRDFSDAVGVIHQEKVKLADNEQNLVDGWIQKLNNLNEDEKELRQEYIQYLKGQLTREDGHLSVPFLVPAPDSSLPPLYDLIEMLSQPPKAAAKKEQRRYLCPPSREKKRIPPDMAGGRIPKPIHRGNRKSFQNEFECPEQMAKCIARSKGMMLAEFVADISRHTADRGHELRTAMKVEVACFSEYVERIITQRIKDLGELLDDKQRQEIIKLQKDCDRWQSELSVCKKRIKEIVPDFDMDLYRRDKNFIKNIFTVGSSDPPSDDKFKEWREENCHRLMWYVDEISKLSEENNQVLEQITAIKTKTAELEKRESEKQKCHTDYINRKSRKYKDLKQLSDKLARDIADMLVSLKS